MNEQSVPANNKAAYIQRLYPLGFREDAQKLGKMTLTLLFSNVLCLWLISTVSLVFMSRLGQAEFNASSLAFTVYLVVSNTVMEGLTYGCDTLLPQCYGGNKRKMGVILQRGVIIGGYACLIVWSMLLNVKYVLKWIAQDQHVVALTDTLLHSYMALVPLDALVLLLRMYIASCERTFALLVINGIGNIVNIISHYICLYLFHMNIHAAPVSITVAYVAIAISAIIYIRTSSLYKETWHPVTRACLQEWNVYLKLALPGVFSVMISDWSFELGGVFGTRLSARSLSAQTVVTQTAWFLSLIMMSIGDAGNILIGQNLGASKPGETINTKNVIYTLSVALVVINMTFIVLTRHWLPYIFNIPESALSLARNALLLGAAYSALNGLNIVQICIVKACGMQKYVTIVSFIGLYVVGLPLTCILTFSVHMDIYGFWIGMIVAEGLMGVMLVILVRRLDFDALSKTAIERIRLDASPMCSQNGLALDTLSSNHTTDEHLQLLPFKVETESDITETQNNYVHYEEKESGTLGLEEPLFKLLKTKIIILLLFICLFTVSVILSVL